MKRPSRLGTTLSTIAIAAALSGCAIGQQNRGQVLGSKAEGEDVGLAMRAQVALASHNLAEAVELAERAVEKTPSDSGLRALLGNCYFAAGRFASAEAAYRDSLTLVPVQPQVVLKLALVQIAQGKNDSALAGLNSARAALDPADYGLAVALAGRPDAAVAVLQQAARMSGADGRVRQNLALAYGLSGDWTMAKTVAAQDVPPDQLDSRIQQWMAMATPTRPSDQVAALVGVTPSADPGLPQRLALNAPPRSEAYARLMAPQAAPPTVERPHAKAEIPAVPPPAMAEPMGPVATASQPLATPAPPVVAEAAQSLIGAPVAMEAEVAQVEASADSQVAAAEAVPAPKAVAALPTRFEAEPKPASFIKPTREIREKAGSYSVVQLGAYSSPERVSVAWDWLTSRFPALANYTPMRARFDSPKGTVWRLSIKGFANQHEAVERCELLRSRGGSCFVRRVQGDAPVQFASR